MPSIQKRKVSVAEELATIEARLTKLETFPRSGMTLLGGVKSAAYISGLPYSALPGNEWQYLSGADVPQVAFTLTRPQPILVIGSMGGFNGSGGTASYIQITCGILPTATSYVAANDINGTEMRNSDMFQTNGSGTANASVNMCYVVPAGSYVVSWGYFMQGGAATTLTISTNSLDVFAISG